VVRLFLTSLLMRFERLKHWLMHSVPRSYMPVTEGRRIPFKTPLLVVGGRRDGEFCDHSLAQYVRW